MTGTPEGSTESGFIEKPGIKPATPGLQGIALIHYTTGASSSLPWFHNQNKFENVICCKILVQLSRLNHACLLI